MNRAFKWKLLSGFVLVFVAGGMLGAFVGARHARQSFFNLQQKILAERMRDRLRAELQLTDDQMAKIAPIIDKTTARLQEIRRNTGRQVHETIVEAHREMAPSLTAEQQAKLQALESRPPHRPWLNHGRRPPPPGPEP
jgi:Spy/CpxP family protein refolding chaperone